MSKQSQPKSQITWISSSVTTDPFITVDNQRRIYFSSQAIGLLDGTNEVMIAYDHANKRLIIGDPRIVRPANVKPHRIDSRNYASARPLINSLGLSQNDLPLRYTYVGKDYTVDGAHAFELMNDDKAGGDGRL